MTTQIKVELQEVLGSDRRIAESAWTSSSDFNGKQKKTDEQVSKVVNMLADHKHATPFESVVFRFWIRMPIAADRQHMTHRIASHNGMSGRYRTMPTDFLDVPEDVITISQKAAYRDGADSANSHHYDDISGYEKLCKKANDWYSNLVSEYKRAEKDGLITNSEFKRAREFFRGVLPQHNMAERVTIMNLRSFANYQRLRNSPHAQPEIRKVAQLMLEAVEKSNVCPVAIEALKRNGWVI